MDYDIKRKLIANQSSAKKTKKLQNELNRSITSIEHLSNEFFYEIFDYLEACDIYNAFSNLNHHFQQLLNSSCLLFKLHFDYTVSEEIYMNEYKPITLLNKLQIFSIELWLPAQGKHFFSLFIIDSSFIRLESFVAKWIEPDVVIPLLVNLASLPRLFSLTIDTQDTGENINEIYRLIFALPTLKYNNFSTNCWENLISLPVATNQQFSTIEILVIDHPCTFNELACLTSYTPELRHLRLHNTNKTGPNIRIISPMVLSNLTYIYIDLYHKTFDELEIIITKICSKLKVLRCITSKDAAFLDGHRWKQFILRYLPDLKKFYLIYHDTVDNKYQHPMYSGGLNQFASSFWIERQCVLEAETIGTYIMYSICPYRKRWYDYPEDKIVNSSIEISKSAKLIIKHVDTKKVIRVNIKRALTIAQIYHLEISESKIFGGVLIRIIDLLPDLITLKIHSLSCRQPRDSSNEEHVILNPVEVKNKISKVYVQETNNIEEFDFLLALCPYMKYLKVGFLNDIDVELFLGHVLKKIHHDCNDHLRLLCFCVPAADDQMIKTLQKMIDDEKLLIDYTIKRVLDNVYIQWK